MKWNGGCEQMALLLMNTGLTNQFVTFLLVSGCQPISAQECNVREPDMMEHVPAGESRMATWVLSGMCLMHCET